MAQMAMEQDAVRYAERKRLLERARGELDSGFIAEAVSDLARVIELLSDSEARVMQLHAECVSMLEQAGKILALDASRRPTIIRLDAETAQSEGEKR